MSKPTSKDTADVNVRMPLVMKKELTAIAQKELTSTNTIVRQFVRDGLDALKEKQQKK